MANMLYFLSALLYYFCASDLTQPPERPANNFNQINEGNYAV